MLGFRAARRLDNRVAELKAVKCGMHTLCEYIRYGGYELSVALPCCFESCDFITLNGINAVVKSEDLSAGDTDLLQEFFSRLGEGCAQAECDRIEMYESLISDRICEAAATADSKTKLFRSGGLCVGLAVGIFII